MFIFVAQHRRSLSESISGLVFSPHTAPSDKARCHLLHRTPGIKLRMPSADSSHEISNQMVLQKIAEIMLLKDQHYKPRAVQRTDDNDSPTKPINPFATLAQFRGVKKILGGPPNSYTSGVGDLFSSCFELPSPFYGGSVQTSKVSSCFDEVDGKTTNIHMNIAKKTSSLPASPVLSRQNSYGSLVDEDKITEKRVNDCVSKLTALNLNKRSPDKNKIISKRSPNCNIDSSTQGKGETPSMENANQDIGTGKNSNSKVKAQTLFTHPLFRNVQEADINSDDDSSAAEKIPNKSGSPECPKPDDGGKSKKTSPILLQKSNSSIELSNENSFAANIFNIKSSNSVMRRRGSCESGIFSVVNEDFSTPTCVTDCCHPGVCPCILRFFCHCKCSVVEKCLLAQYCQPCIGDPVDSNQEGKGVSNSSSKSYQDSDSVFDGDCDCNPYSEESTVRNISHNEQDEKKCNSKLDAVTDNERNSHFNETSKCQNKSGCDAHFSLCRNCLYHCSHNLHNKYCPKNVYMDHILGSRTFSSSSANSSLFLLDDSALSTTTVSSLRSLDDLDCLNPSTSREHIKGACDTDNPSHVGCVHRKHLQDVDFSEYRFNNSGKQSSESENNSSESGSGGYCQCKESEKNVCFPKDCSFFCKCCVLYHYKSNKCPFSTSYSNIDIDARSIDLGLVNRLAMDEEINNLIFQKNTLTNQLLYSSSKRTSSIYTDSSDDISSLAGSDSLCFEDRTNYGSMNNTRSAQISKIVEYFERKGANFKPTNFKNISTVNSSFGQNPAHVKTNNGNIVSKYTSSDFLFNSKTPRKSEIFDIRRHFDGEARNFSDRSGLGESSRRISELRHRISGQNKYSDICFSIDMGSNNIRKDDASSSSQLPSCSRKCLSQQRLMVCEGAVKSKLPIFDRKK